MSIGVEKTKTVIINDFENCQGGQCSWTLSITRNDDDFFIGMHWGGKPFPTHEAKISVSEFMVAVNSLGEGE